MLSSKLQKHHNTSLAMCEKLVSWYRIGSSRRTSLLRFGVNTAWESWLFVHCRCSKWVGHPYFLDQTVVHGPGQSNIFQSASMFLRYLCMRVDGHCSSLSHLMVWRNFLNKLLYQQAGVSFQLLLREK